MIDKRFAAAVRGEIRVESWRLRRPIIRLSLSEKSSIRFNARASPSDDPLWKMTPLNPSIRKE
jgi:hypothetical protein